MGLTEWLDYVTALHPHTMRLGLDAMQTVLQSLGGESFDVPVVTVAGTNGKGSVIRILEEIFLASGYRVAAYTSPHVLSFCERLRINGQVVLPSVWVEAFAVVERKRCGHPLTFFEFTTLAALYICQHSELDILLLEVGLGGRLDAVNAIAADIAVITTIDLDHTDYLGHDRESIGREKAGILRAHRPCIFGDHPIPHSVAKLAEQLQSPLYQGGKDFHITQRAYDWDWYGPQHSYQHLPYPNLKLENAAASLMVVDLLARRLPTSRQAVCEGLSSAYLPGRFEIIRGGSPVTILDVAHNPQAARYLAEQLAALSIKGVIRAVLGVLKDKDVLGICEALDSYVHTWYIGSLEGDRGVSSDVLAATLTESNNILKYITCSSIASAMDRALADAKGGDYMLVFGSFQTVARAKHYLACVPSFS